MKKLDLNIPVLDESGKELKSPITLAKSLGNTILQSSQTKESDILKLYTWALQLGQTGVIQIDKADSVMLKTFIATNTMLFIIVKAPLLMEIDKLKF